MGILSEKTKDSDKLSQRNEANLNFKFQNTMSAGYKHLCNVSI